MTVSARVRELVEPVVAAHDLELFDIDQNGSTLVVTVEHEGGVDIDALGVVTRAISRALDRDDPIAGRYTLEVSSPGLERKLRTPRHFAWAIGREVSIKTVPSYVGERRMQGTVSAADEGGIVLDVDDGARVRVAYDEIDSARTVFEWGPGPKPGDKGRAGRVGHPGDSGHAGNVAATAGTTETAEKRVEAS